MTIRASIIDKRVIVKPQVNVDANAFAAQVLDLAEPSITRSENAASSASAASLAAQAFSNFKQTRAEGVTDIAVGEYFSSAETGDLRLYKRIAGAPGYEDMGDVVAPLTQGNLKFQTGGSTDSFTFNPKVNAIAPGTIAAAIIGGGSTGDAQKIGYFGYDEALSGVGTSFTWPHIPTALGNLRVFKKTIWNSRTALVSGTDYTAALNGSGGVTITLTVALVSGERLLVHDSAASILYDGTRPDYSLIIGGYDCTIRRGVMQQVTGAHHRIHGGDHGTILGGSYAEIRGGSYGTILGGTDLELGLLAGVGATAVGGIRNYVNSSGAIAAGGAENSVLGAYAFVTGYRNKVNGSYSVSFGTTNTVLGSHSFVIGDSNSTSSNYNFAFGYGHSITHLHSQARGGSGGVSRWAGQSIGFAWRTTSQPKSQDSKTRLHLRTANTTPALLQFVDGATASIIPPNNSISRLSIRVLGRAANGATGYWNYDFVLKRTTTTTTFFNGVTPTPQSGVEDGFREGGVAGGNPAKAEISINASGGVEILVTPRPGFVMNTDWTADCEMFELSA